MPHYFLIFIPARHSRVVGQNESAENSFTWQRYLRMQRLNMNRSFIFKTSNIIQTLFVILTKII
jgi:hypothetical protein